MDLTHGAPIREKGRNNLEINIQKLLHQPQKESTLAWGMLQDKPSGSCKLSTALSRELGSDGVTLKGFNYAQKLSFLTYLI